MPKRKLLTQGSIRLHPTQPLYLDIVASGADTVIVIKYPGTTKSLKEKVKFGKDLWQTTRPKVAAIYQRIAEQIHNEAKYQETVRLSQLDFLGAVCDVYLDHIRMLESEGLERID